MNTKIKVIITEDQDRWRQILIRELQPFEIDIIGIAENGLELLKLLETLVPDVVLLDLEMDIMDGSTALDIILKKIPTTKILILSTFYHAFLCDDFIDRGAMGYLPKTALAEDVNGIPKLIDGIRHVNASKIYFNEYPKEERVLNKKQKKILPLIFNGLTSEEIGKEIGITTRAVQKQKKGIYRAFGVDKAIDLYKYAFAKGLQFLGFNKK